MADQMLSIHDHPFEITSYKKRKCDICGNGSWDMYWCHKCRISLHNDCVDRYVSKPFLCNHLLNKILSPEDISANDRCHFCRCDIYSLSSTSFKKNCMSTTLARCMTCNISVHLHCMSRLPPLTIFQPKLHKHSLTLLFRVVTFTCNACGLEDDRNPYVCLECNFMVHADCINLPRVISINRHDHRIYHTFHLGQREGDWKCGVCRKTVDWVYGAFKCSRCPSYAVHSKCAARKEVWDGIELEDVPEEEEEIEDPYKVLNATDIIHFSHEQHILRLDENYVMENDNMRCGGCISPINDNPCYKCVACDFCLHKSCANLPRKKRHLCHNHKLILQVDEVGSFMFGCAACRRTSSKGFRYTCSLDCNDRICFDVRCSSILEPFDHDLHPHPLYFTLEGFKRCDACLGETDEPLSCTECEYDLCMTCATLPRKVKHRCDDHFLSLSQGDGNSNGDLWCDICETKTDPSVCYYACHECGLNLHIKCVLGDDVYFLKVGNIAPGVEILANNSVTRPLCNGCEVRCKFPFVLRRTIEESVRDFCSVKCFAL